MPAGVHGVEIGDAIDTQDDGLAIEHKLLDAVLQGGLGAGTGPPLTTADQRALVDSFRRQRRPAANSIKKE